MSKLLKKQTAEELVISYNMMAQNWSPVMCTVDRVVLTFMATLRDPDVVALIDKLRSKETDNSKRALAFMVALNSSPYGEGFETFIRHAIEHSQEVSANSERVVTLFRAELAFMPGWEKAAKPS